MAEPATPGHLPINPLIKFGIISKSKWVGLAGGTLWHLGLKLLRLHEGHDGLSTITVQQHLLQAFLSLFLGKMCVPQVLWVAPLEDSDVCDCCFFMQFL